MVRRKAKAQSSVSALRDALDALIDFGGRGPNSWLVRCLPGEARDVLREDGDAVSAFNTAS